MARRTKQLTTTAMGVLVWPHLNSPDYEYDEAGVYQTKLRLSGTDAEAFLAYCTEQQVEAAAEAKENGKYKGKGKVPLADLPYKEDEDGNLLFNFKMKAKGTTRNGETFTREPKLFDAAGQPCNDARVGGGTVARISFEPYRYYAKMVGGAGVSLRLEAVQIIELQEWTSGRSAEGFGFEATDGFSVDEYTPQNTPATDSDSDDDDADDEDGDDNFDF